MKELIDIKTNIVYFTEVWDQSSGNEQQTSYISPLNADSIYSTTYTVLRLTLRLSTEGFYETGDKTIIPMSEVITTVSFSYMFDVFPSCNILKQGNQQLKKLPYYFLTHNLQF